MAVNSRIDNVSNEGFSLVIEDDGSGDPNRIMGELCKKHLESKERGEEKEPRSPEEIGREILQANSEEEEAALDELKAQLDADLIEVLKVVTELNTKDKLSWLDQCEFARKHGMVPYDDHSADRIFHNNHFVVSYDSKQRVYYHQKISV